MRWCWGRGDVGDVGDVVGVVVGDVVMCAVVDVKYENMSYLHYTHIYNNSNKKKIKKMCLVNILNV